MTFTALLYLFQDPPRSIVSPYIEAALLLWPVWTVIVVAFGIVFGYRLYEKSGIRKTNEATIDGLEGLLETRDRQLAAKDEELKATQKELESVRTEYKVVAGLVLADLITWAGRWELHRATLAAKDSEIRVLQNRIEIMEKREAENAEIHKSK